MIKIPLPPMAISIRQPWCHRILHDGKDVENRSWPTRFRGPVLIHASSGVDSYDRAEVQGKAMPTGGIVGIMDIADCVTEWPGDWFFGPYGFVIRNARPLSFVPCRGKLGFFRVDEAVMAELRRNNDREEEEETCRARADANRDRLHAAQSVYEAAEKRAKAARK